MSGSFEIILLKYNSDGVRQWTAETGTSGLDYGYGVVAAPDSLHVYVTGLTSSALNGQGSAGQTNKIILRCVNVFIYMCVDECECCIFMCVCMCMTD